MVGIHKRWIDQIFLRIVGMQINFFPIRISIDAHRFSAIAADSLYIEEIENLEYLWINSGERYDILVKTRKEVSNLKTAFKMRFIGFTDWTDNSTALCSIAWFKYPHQEIEPDYIHPDGDL